MAMTLRLDAEDDRALEALAEMNGISKQEAARQAIRETAARQQHQQKVHEASARARDRYADVLDRLGQ